MKKACGNIEAGGERGGGRAGFARAESAHTRRRARGAGLRLYRDACGPRRSHTLLRASLRAAGALTVVSVLAFTSLFAYHYWHYSKVVDARLAGGYLTSRAGVYAAPRVLRAGQKLTPERLAVGLRRAGYVGADEPGRVWSGRFRAEGAAVRIEPAVEDNAAAGPREVVVSFDRAGRVAEVRADGAEVESYALEPEPLADETELRSAGREALTYAELPPVLVAAVLSTEDRRFFKHGGVDLWGVLRAALSWGERRGEEVRQGGSTVTQQLVKNTYLTPERTLRRKFHEAVLASVIERRLSKEEILALYCNEVYLGQRGGVAVRGVRQAARAYFGKELKDLTLSEAAAIAGMIQAPARYAPDRHPEEARARRDTVLAAMVRDGAVASDEARDASREPLRVVPVEQRDATAPYFVDYVNRFVESLDAAGAEGGRPARVHTTLDLDLQRAAEEVVAEQLDRLGKTFKGGRRPQAALVALDPHDGRVLAMVGGASYAESQLNRATDARRQPGSVFKPVVYAAALEAGLSPLSVSLDAPRQFAYDRGATYRPANYGGGYSNGEVTLREALVRSLNVVAVDAGLRTGLNRVASMAERLGLPRPESYPSLALGTTEATPLEVAAAYTAFAAGGRLARPTPLAGVDGGAGGGARPYVTWSQQVLRPSTSYMMTDMLGAVVERGTARAARGRFGDVAVAGKTGTSRDGWFAGYTPNLVCVVWVGFDDGTELGLTGGDSALPVWAEFVSRAVELRPELGGREFARPGSISVVEIDPETGARAHAACPRRERVALTPTFVPSYECPLHNAPLVMATAADGFQPPWPAGPPPTATHFAGHDAGDAAVYNAGNASPYGAGNAAADRAGLSARQRTRETSPAPGAASQPPNTQPAAGRARADGPGPPADAPATRPTRVEVGHDGRARLTNDLRPASRAESWRR
ncbi:MAG TPA: PBP1A family penicillin-binding protein [Pyrinomonadaceae bacterium]|nr:PBP1A family penicillin-binding protein [Pyrinomonadaceae bacterium]